MTSKGIAINTAPSKRKPRPQARRPVGARSTIKATRAAPPNAIVAPSASPIPAPRGDKAKKVNTKKISAANIFDMMVT